MTSYFRGEEAAIRYICRGNGALGRDGCIYALATEYQVGFGDFIKHVRFLKIDTVNNSYCLLGDRIKDSDNGGVITLWGDPILGIDGCIYWLPCAGRTLKYDPHTNRGDEFVSGEDIRDEFSSAALATDGVIYCIPPTSNRVLAIDPLGEFIKTTRAHMENHPEKFGILFQTIEADEDSVQDVSLTNFDHAVIKFGQNKVFEALEKSMKPINDFCKNTNLFPFMIASSCKDSILDAIYHLLHRDLSWVNSYISSSEGKQHAEDQNIRVK